MGGPAPAVPAPDATCTLLPLTSFPKNKIKVLLLENISHTAVEMFESERFQIVSNPMGYRPENEIWLPPCIQTGGGAKLQDTFPDKALTTGTAVEQNSKVLLY